MMNRINNMRIRSKFILLYLVGVFLPLVIIITFFTGSITTEIRRREEKNNELSFGRAVSSMKEQFSGVYTLSNAISADNQLKPLLSKTYETPLQYYENYFYYIRPQVQRYMNAYAPQVSGIQLYCSNPTVLSVGVCLNIQEAGDFSRLLGSDSSSDTVRFIAHVVSHPGAVDKVQVSLLRGFPGLSPHTGVIRIDLSMEPIYKAINQESGTMDLYLIAPDGKLVCSPGSTNLPAFDVRSSVPPENPDTVYDLGQINGMKGWKLLAFHNTEPMDENIHRAQLLSCFICLLFLIFTGVLSYVMSSSITRRSSRLLQSMDNADPENYSPVDTPVSNDEIGELTVHFNAMNRRINELIQDVYQLQIQKNSMELERTRGELKYLQSQLDPHFLFNTLNGLLVTCVKSGYTELASVIQALSKIMRRMLDTKNDIVTLNEEISFVNMVLQIEKFRFGDKLDYTVSIPDCLMGCTVPIMSVQCLVENACKHGIQHKSGVGTITIGAENVDKMLRISVTDNGAGMNEEALAQVMETLHSSSEEGSNIGLRNIYRRLKLFYGECASLDIWSRENEGTVVTMTVPMSGRENPEE